MDRQMKPDITQVIFMWACVQPSNVVLSTSYLVNPLYRDILFQRKMKNGLTQRWHSIENPHSQICLWRKGRVRHQSRLWSIFSSLIAGTKMDIFANMFNSFSWKTNFEFWIKFQVCFWWSSWLCVNFGASNDFVLKEWMGGIMSPQQEEHEMSALLVIKIFSVIFMYWLSAYQMWVVDTQ